MNSYKIFLIIFLILIFSLGANAETIKKNTELANITVQFPEDILIERGWTSYVSFSVSNTGKTILNNVYIFVDGKFNWFDFQADRTYSIPINESIDFTNKILVPYETPTGEYDFLLKIRSNEIGYEKNFTVSVFDNRDDMLLYQIEKLRDETSELETEADSIEKSGANLTYARSLMYQIKSELNSAESDVQGKMYTQVTNSIRDVEQLLIKVKFEVSNPPPEAETKKQISLPFESIIFFAPFVVIAIMSVLLIYLIRKVKIQNSVRLPNLKLKEAIVENKRVIELEKEISKTIGSQKLIDEEYRQGMISKESYDELRLKYQERLVNLEAEKKRLRGY